MTQTSGRELAGALGAGVLCGTGLVLSGMTRPSKVLGFLDVFGSWDPSLAYVMVGAIAVHATSRAWARRKAHGAAGHSSEPPFAPSRITVNLILGAALFGVGWGLVGYCPGPGVVALGTGSPRVVVFIVSVLFGAWLVQKPGQVDAV